MGQQRDFEEGKLGKSIDQLYKLREARLKLTAQADALKEQEGELRETILKGLSQLKLESARGSVATVTRNVKHVPKVEDFDALTKYIKRTGEFDLLHRRVSDAAVRERWAAKKEVPGVSSITVIDLNVSKAGAKKETTAPPKTNARR